MNFRNLSATLTLLAGLFLMTSCGKDDDKIIDQVTRDITDGTWYISNFDDSGTDKTSNFTGYNFTFGETGVLTAQNGALINIGTWEIVDGDENDDVLDDLDFNISFPDLNGFGDLNDDWHIFAQSDDNLELIESGGITDNDLLSFKQN